MSKKIICPSCWHEETFRSIQNNRERVSDDPITMNWIKPYGGPRGQQVTVWDNGWWSCEMCGLRLTESNAFLLIDAVLRVSDPDSDSYDEKAKTFKDSSNAYRPLKSED